jgi:hypothetical protein
MIEQADTQIGDLISLPENIKLVIRFVVLQEQTLRRRYVKQRGTKYIQRWRS